MEDTLLVSPAPHVRSAVNTRRIMLDVVIALIPTLIASAIIFGFRALGVTALCVAVCVISEWAFEKLCKRDVTVGDLSAVVTGILLAFNLPSTIPLWQAAFGSIVAIVVVKQLFGGIGRNFANPAITARVVLLISFAGSMSSFKDPINDAVSGATPLAILGGVNGTPPTMIDMLIGNRGGAIGETCVIALLLGGIYLLIRRVISWHIPTIYIGTVFLFSLALTGDVNTALYHVLAGGLILGAIFMATDPVTSPKKGLGKIIFALGCGIMTVLIRFYGVYPEGVSFAILIMNILTPYIDKIGAKKEAGGAENE